MATQTMQAMGPTTHNMAQKPLPSLPSPTLTNPDMVLPDEPRRYGPVNSPPRYGWSGRERPPSPSYLRERSNNSGHRPQISSGDVTPKQNKEKRGLMSRKMMLERSRTASDGMMHMAAVEGAGDDEFEGFDAVYASSPTLREAGHLAPAQPDRRASAGGSSLDSDDMASLPQFLAKYQNRASMSTDDENYGGTPTWHRSEASVDGNLEAHRRQAEEDEHTSALLSQRAEQILANAKKRLNLMEGNLRGARDLVQPLTAANLKRATSVGSSYVSPAGAYGGRNRAVYDRYDYQSPSHKAQHRLSAQASAPHLAQEYHQGHWRGYSETELPDRPYTSMERGTDPTLPNVATPNRARGQNWTNTLKGSRSYDSLGAVRWQTSRDAGHTRPSPDPNLEPLVEDDGHYHAMSTSMDRRGSQQDGLGIHSPDSRTDDLREQMSSLKGKISSLRERAREDSLRRQSMQNLREPSPLNNATINAPEFFYTSSPSYGRPPLDTNAGIGWTSPNNTPPVQQTAVMGWESEQMVTGSRNAFAEEEERMRQQEQQRQRRKASQGSSQKSSEKMRRIKPERLDAPQGSLHKRTPSGTAIVQPSKHRYSHHQQQRSIDSTESPVIGRAESAASNGRIMPEDEPLEAGGSVYEDAESELQSSVVAHEDREDAFDYKNFFLHSAMKAYGRRDSSASSGESTTSTATAKAPAAAGAADEDGAFLMDGAEDEDEYEELEDDGDIDDYPPPSPETPERLREIERGLHKRTFSGESVSTLATFATATEGRTTPPINTTSQRSSMANWPITASRSNNNNSSRPNSRPGSRPGSRPDSRPNSRPSTAIPIKVRSPNATSDTSSERADSGVGGLPSQHQPQPQQRSYSSQSAVRPPPALHSVFGGPRSSHASPTLPTHAAGSAAKSPPMSPGSPPVDPATVAVNALLAPEGRQLGLRDKAVLFGLVESLSRTCRRLQEGEETDYESRALRRRLDDARRVLEGRAEMDRPGSS